MFTKKFRFVSSLILSIAVLFMATCTPQTAGGEAADREDPIKIGAIHDLTGPTSDVGTPYTDGIHDYVKFVNENGGVGGREIELLSQDYAYDVSQAEQLYSQYVSQGVVAFQGWGTGDTEALRGKIADDEIPFMSASYSAALTDPAEAPYNFLIGTSYSDQFIIVIRYAIENSEEAPTVALFHHDSPFGTSPLEDGRAYAEANGASVLSFPMPRGATDFTAELTQAQEAGADYVVIQNVSSPAATLLKDIARLGLAVQTACLNWCSDEILADLAGEAAEGMLGASPFAFPSSGADLIENEIRPWAEANERDVDVLGVHYVQGWTTMKAMIDGIRQVVDAGDPVTGPNIKAVFESWTDYDTGGITSPISFSPEDHAGSKSLQLYQITNGTWERISDYISASE